MGGAGRIEEPKGGRKKLEKEPKSPKRGATRAPSNERKERKDPNANCLGGGRQRGGNKKRGESERDGKSCEALQIYFALRKT